MNILFEDKFILICEKPAGVSSEPDGSGEDVVTAASCRAGKDCLLVHRLDRVTGGAMVLAKTPAAAAKLSAMIQNRSFLKEYLAVVEGVPAEKAGVMQDLLFKDSRRNKSFVVTRKRAGVKDASLEYRLIGVSESGTSLVLVRLHTGRTHQIRVQFASRGMPLLGDGKYGSRENKCTAALWSCRIGFKHPMTGEDIMAVSMPERKWPWTEFDFKSLELL